jgi:hypothetical protein
MRLIALLVAALLSVSNLVFAANPVNVDASGVAASGHDVIAYF